MDIIRLRTLTRKSKLGFGKYSDDPIWFVLQNKHTQYLRWCYYCNSTINFTDDILDEIGISKDYKIDKPGVNEELHFKLNKEKQKTIGWLKKRNNRCYQKRRTSACFASFKRMDASNYSNMSLTRKNHGH